MSSQIAPRDSCIISLCDNPSSISAQTVTNERSLEEAGQRQKNANEENLTAIDDLYRPVLKVMKLSGAYFGATSLANAVNSSRPRCHLSQLYCAIVAAGLWFDFVMPVVSAILGGNIYLHIMFISWCLLVALLGTTCLIVLPSTATRTSRFETFIRKVISLDIERPYLEKVKSRLKVYLIMFSILAIASVGGAFLTDLLLEMNIANAWPWKKWFVFRITSLIFLTCSIGVWFFPIPLFCATCLILEACFDDLYNLLSPQHPNSSHSNLLSIESLRQQHQNLCQLVEAADSLFSPLLLEIVGFSIPVMCFNFYQVAHSQNKKDLAFVISVLFWLLSSATILTVVLINGSKVSEKIHAVQKILPKMPAAAEEEGKVLLLMMDLQGEPRGLSIGGLSVITKSLSISIVGVIISYVAVILSLPS
ncbi:uncharacterized protein [Montipora capricornis]|uniref:uncharacterized protein isoform X1 n=1 Tax=Montipora capricornis TaxID=246305 RepID=UPI0035F16585